MLFHLRLLPHTPSNNINEGPGPHYPGYPSGGLGDGRNRRPPAKPPTQPSRQAGINVIHRLGQKANQTYVQQIRVCVFSCHRYCAGLLRVTDEILSEGLTVQESERFEVLAPLPKSPPPPPPASTTCHETFVMSWPGLLKYRRNDHP